MKLFTHPYRQTSGSGRIGGWLLYSHFIILSIIILFSLPLRSFSQDIVYWRVTAPNGEWEWGTSCNSSGVDGNWHYTTSGNGERQRPDCFSQANIIHFDNTNQPVMNLNSLSDYSVNCLEFDAGTNDRTINTNASRSLYFKQNGGNAKIENNVALTTHTFNVNVNVEPATFMEINPNNGYLVFNNPVVNNSANPINIYGFQQVTFNGDIMGNPGLTINNGARVIYGGVSKTYSGTTTINNGTTLQISSNQTLNSIVLNTGGTLSVDAGITLTIAGTWTGGGTIINNGTIILTGPAAFPGTATTVSQMNNLSINRAGGVTLDKAVTLSGILTLSSGILTTTATNLITLSNTATTAISGGSTSAFISGPVRWTLPSNLVAGAIYYFPVGKGGTYYPISVIDPLTGAGVITLTAEAYSGATGGTAGAPLSTLSLTEYWSLASSGNFTNSKVSLTRQTPVSPFTTIGRSTTLTGTYSTVGGTASGNAILNSNNTGAGVQQYFVMATGPIHVAGAVGGNGDYATLAAAFTAINGTVQTGASIVVTINGPTTEPAAGAILNAGTWASLLIYPTGSGYIITGAASANPEVDLNGADNVTIDGRVNMTGPIDLTFTKPSSTSVIRFINDAKNNTVKYCKIYGPASANGVVFFSTSTFPDGNDNNTITNCDIGPSTPAVASFSTYLVYSAGSANSNDNNTISNCLVRDFYSSTADHGAVYIAANNSGWIIDGNSIYQASSIAGNSTTSYGIRINNAGNNHQVRNNYIGGKAANCSGGKWTITGTNASLFVGISFSAGLTGNTIEGNTIKEFDWSTGSSAGSTGSSPGVWCGILIQGSGNTTVGNPGKGNFIGDNVTGSVIVTANSNGASGATTYAIASKSSGTTTIQYNTIGSINATGSSNNRSASLIGIQVENGTNNVSNNSIGTATTNSLNCTNASTNNNSQYIRGIVFNNGGTAVSLDQVISNNTIRNLNNNYNGGTASQNRGISIEAGAGSLAGSDISITGNTISSISCSQNVAPTGVNTNITGVHISATTASSINISGNTIYGLNETGGTAAVNIAGIFINGPGGANNTVSKNMIYSLTTNSTSTTAAMNGIRTQGGTVTYSNNIVSLGSGSGRGQFFGFFDGGGTNTIYHNTITLNNGPATVNATDAALFTNSNNTRNIRNNIFYCTRTGGSGVHYAVNISTVSGLTIDWNDFTGTVNVTGGGGGANSITTNPLLPNPSGTALTDYIPGAVTLTGTNLISTVPDDIDGSSRCVPTMGAQEVPVLPGTPGAISGTASVLQGANGIAYSVPAVSNATSYVWSYSGVGATINGTTNNITINFACNATSGNLTVYGVNACGNGPVSAAYPITVNSAPNTVTASASPNPICSGNTLNLTGSAVGATSWSWTGPNGYTSSLQNPTVPNIPVAGAGVYTLTASNACGSASPVNTAFVVVNQSPVGTNDIITTCSGTSPSYNLSAGIPSTFTWTIGTINGGITGASAGSGNTINQVLTNPSNSAIGSVQYIVTPTSISNGCVGSTFMITVIVEPAPAVNPVANLAYCSGQTGAAIVFGSSVPGSTYNWTCSTNVGFGTSGTGNIPSFGASNGGAAPVVATVTVHATSPSGCIGPNSTFTITINPTPAASISSDYCIVPGKIRLTAFPAPPGYTYLWSNGATTQVIEVNVAGIYSVSVTNSFGCASTAFSSVAIELVANGDFTAGNVGFTSDYYYRPDIPAYNQELVRDDSTYAYSVGTNGQNFHPNFWGQDHTNNAVGPRNFMLVNGHGTLIIWRQTINVTPNTDYYFSAWAMSLNSVGPYANLKFSINGTQVGVPTGPLPPRPQNDNPPFNWSQFYGNWNSGASTTALLEIVDLETAAGGNDFGLDDISFGTLSASSAIPSPTANGGNIVCEGGTLNLAANINGGIPPYSYTWTGPNGFTSTQANPVISPVTLADAGTYWVTVTDGFNCPPTPVSVTVTVTPSPASPTSALVDRNNFCEDDAGNITLTAIGGSGGTLNWYSGSCGGTLVGPGTTLTIPSPTATTTYFARWESACGSPSCASVTVTVLTLPTASTSVTATPNPVCAGANLTLTSNGGSGGTGSNPQLVWYSGSCGGTLVGTGTPLTITAPFSNTTYYARWESSCGFSSCQSVAVTVNPLPVAPVSAATNRNNECGTAGGNMELTASGGSGDVYNWYESSCGGTPIGTGALLTYPYPTVTTTYYVNYTNSCGASSCASVTVNVIPLPAPPTSVSSDQPGGYCSSTPPPTVTLTASGGNGTTLAWYTGGCGTTPLGTGLSYIVNPAPTATTTYYARWENACGNSACESVTVNVLEPIQYTVTGGGFCAPTNTTTSVTLSGSQIGVNYQLYNSTNNPVGAPVAGTGSPINLPSPPSYPPAGIGYYVIATIASPPNCQRQMSGTANISMVTPIAYNVTAVGASSYCSGGSGVVIRVSNSQIGYTYELYLNGNPTGVTVYRSGPGAFNFPAQTAPGIYTVFATRTITTPNCSIWMNGSVTITVNPVPIIPDQADTICSGQTFTIIPVNGIPVGTIVPTGTTYTWGVPVVTGGITGGTAQTGQTSISQALTNPTPVVQTATYIVTPTSPTGPCTGAAFTVTVLVNPAPSTSTVWHN